MDQAAHLPSLPSTDAMPAQNNGINHLCVFSEINMDSVLTWTVLQKGTATIWQF
jgi:hypothetical protein